MKPEARANLEAMYWEHFRPRQGKGLPFNLDDHVKQVRIAEKVGISDRNLADALGMPVNYVHCLKAALAEED